MDRVLIPIGLVGNLTTTYPFVGLRRRYIEKLRQHGLQPILVPNDTNEQELEDYLSLSHGVLFIGGIDFDPAFYGQVKHPRTIALDTCRDKIELLILKKLLDSKMAIPFLGICRGMQAAAIAGGGELYQHLPDVTHEIHDKLEPENASYECILNNPKNLIHIVHGSKLHNVLQRNCIEVNTSHHQGVKNPGIFAVTAITDEGIIEAIQHPERSSFFAVQFHAELQAELDPVFQAFCADVRNYRATLKRQREPAFL